MKLNVTKANETAKQSRLLTLVKQSERLGILARQVDENEEKEGTNLS